MTQKKVTIPFLNLRSGEYSDLSDADMATIRYNLALGRLEASIDGGPYQALGGSGDGGVSSVGLDGGTTGLTFSGTNPITTSGTLTLTGTLGAANGGTGLASPGALNNVLTSDGAGGWTSIAATAPSVLTVEYAASITLDFDPALSPYQKVTLAGDLTLLSPSANLGGGRALSLLIIGDGSIRTLTLPAWSFLGAAAPATLAVGQKAVLSLTSYGTADADVIAAYAAVVP